MVETAELPDAVVAEADAFDFVELSVPSDFEMKEVIFDTVAGISFIIVVASSIVRSLTVG